MQIEQLPVAHIYSGGELVDTRALHKPPLVREFVKSLTLRDAKPQPAGARSLDDAIRALEGVVAVRPSVGPALELLKKERRALK